MVPPLGPSRKGLRLTAALSARRTGAAHGSLRSSRSTRTRAQRGNPVTAQQPPSRANGRGEFLKSPPALEKLKERLFEVDSSGLMFPHRIPLCGHRRLRITTRRDPRTW